MKKIFLLTIILGLFLILVSCGGQTKQPSFQPSTPTTNPAEPQTIIVTVEGVGTDRTTALTDSRLRALQEVVGLSVFGTTQVTNFTLVDRTVLTKTQGYIKSEKIINEGPHQSVYYKVTVLYEVSKEIPQSDYFYIIQQMNKPKIGVWLPSKAYKGLLTFEDRSAEIALQSKLLQYGFDVYDTERLQELIQIREGEDPDYTTLRKYGVDVLITGEVFGESTGTIYGMQGARSNANLKAYWTQTGRLISSAFEQAGDNDISAMVAAKKAVQNASTAVGEVMSKDIIKNWMDSLANGLPIQISLHNTNIDEMIEFRNHLRNTPGIVSVSSPVIEGNYAEMIVTTFLDSFDFYANAIRNFFGTRARLDNQYLTLITLTLQ
jgi:hypothetical protein